MGDFYTNTTNINNELRNRTDNSDQSIAAIDPLLVKALILYKRARIGNDIHKYWFAFSCPIGLVSITT